MTANFFKIVMRVLPVLIWLGVIYYFSDMPEDSKSYTEQVFGQYKDIAHRIAHIIENAILFILCCQAQMPWVKKNTGQESIQHRQIKARVSLVRVFIVSFVICVAYAYIDEWHQLYAHTMYSTGKELAVEPSPGYVSEFSATSDVLIDLLGACLAFCIIILNKAIKLMIRQHSNESLPITKLHKKQHK